MGSAVPAAPAPAPAAPAPAPAQQAEPNLASTVLQALDPNHTPGRRAPAPQPPQHQPPAAQPVSQGQGQDRLAALLALAPEAEREAYAQELNHLKAQAGRVAAAERRQQEQQQPQQTAAEAHAERIAEALLISNVQQNPARLHELAAMAGVDPQVLAQAAGITPGAQPPGRAGQPSAQELSDPKLFTRMYDVFRQESALDHPRSWTKPIFELRRQAQTFANRALEHKAEARVAADAGSKAHYEQLAKEAEQLSETYELQAMQTQADKFAGLINALNHLVHDRLSPFEELVKGARARDEAAAAQEKARETLVNDAASALFEDGSARFGPTGYGIFNVDASGNVTGMSPMGKTQMPYLETIIRDYNFSWDAEGLERAIHILASYDTTDSDGANGNPAGAQQPGGVNAYPAGAPGSYPSDPSLAGRIHQQVLQPEY